jgi:hypothetical protein
MIIFLDLSFQTGVIDALIRGVPDLVNTYDGEWDELVDEVVDPSLV